MTTYDGHGTSAPPAPGMTIRKLAVEGAFEITPVVFPDDRGLFVATYQESIFTTAVGHPFRAVQTSHATSRRGVVRGVHFTTTPPGTAKYVYCARGRALDLVVDLRVGSPTFGQWESIELDQEHFRATYLPVGVGHAYVALEDDTVMTYLMSGEYVAELELAVSPMDPALALPVRLDQEPVVSERDRVAPTVDEALAMGILPDYATSMKIERSA